MADSERERIRERTVRGKRSKVKAGRIYVNGMPPYGYKEKKEVIGEGEDIRIKRTLVVEPEEAEVVQEIYEMYLSDSSVSCTTIAKHLTAKGITPPGHTRYISDSHRVPADAPWPHRTIYRILERKTYVGTWEYGKKGEGGTIPVAVEPIIALIVAVGYIRNDASTLA